MNKKIPVINAFRGYAMLCVLWLHMWGDKFGPFVNATLFSVRDVTIVHYRAIWLLNYAVQVFFILSGFVLMLPYARGERVIHSWSGILEFLKHRARRLLPLYYLNIAVAMVVLGSLLSLDPAAALRDVFLMSTATFHFTKAFWYPRYNGVLWSMGVEIWFSVLFPFLLVVMHKSRPIPVLMFAFALSTAVGLIGYRSHGTGINFISDNVIGDLHYFVVGMLIAIGYAKNPHRSLRPYVALCGAYGIIASVIALDWINLRSPIAPHVTTMFAVTILLFQVSWYALISELLLLRKSIALSIIANRPIQLLGLMSYSVYVWHRMILDKVGTPLDLYRFFLFVFVMFGISWLSYRYVEFRYVKHPRSLLPEKAQ